MSVQLTLPGLEAAAPPAPPRRRTFVRRPQPPYNLFFAVRPEPDDAARIAALGLRWMQEQGVRGRPLPAARLHVSLHNLGGYEAVPQPLVDRAVRLAQALSFPSFDVVFDQAMVFRGREAPYVLCGGDGLDALRQFRLVLGMAMADADLPATVRFTPHMTLCYRGQQGLVHSIAPLRWTAREFVLINSHYGKTEHELLGCWPLHPS